ncbi:cupin domain-containing protein [Amycolatopsis jejuensis]|uniref:cupin domain-containing protein n=1 Tax=Amycolatopsis jejuensis TaxID=330084 RepID=UPI000524535B|nr:cupin domain-containing protein [Amycolatopsis jejuensis]
MHIFRTADATFAEPPGHFGGLRTTNVVGTEVGKRYSIALAEVPPGGGGEDHQHDAEQQTFLVLSGSYRFRSGDKQFTLGPGEAVLFEPGEYHETLNESAEQVTCLVVTVFP